MNDHLITAVSVWDLYERTFEFLMVELLVAVAVMVLAALILIFSLCWDATRTSVSRILGR